MAPAFLMSDAKYMPRCGAIEVIGSDRNRAAQRLCETHSARSCQNESRTDCPVAERR
jgi:hypothetical protein